MKAKYQLLTSPEDGTAARFWNYTTTLAVKNTLEKGFFSSLRNNLMPGDTITVRRSDAKNRIGRLYEMVTLTVVETTALTVRVEKTSDIVVFKHEDDGVKKEEPDGVQYAREGWTAVHDGGPWFVVKDEKGKTVTGKMKKAEATLIATGSEPLPKAA